MTQVHSHFNPHSEYIDWKGPFFHQISSTTKFNAPDAPSVNNGGNIFRALPLKHYRKELPGTTNTTCLNNLAYHNPGRISDINRPGGTVVHSSSTQFRQDIIAPIISQTNTTGGVNDEGTCVIPSEQANARRRIRSAGMVRTNLEQSRSGGRYYTTGSQYLYNRNMTVAQNQTTLFKEGNENMPGQPGTYNNIYSSGTSTPFCPDNPDAVYPVYYKPNNYKYAQQGAVSSGDKIFRLKYDTITYGGQAVNTEYGVLKTNALAYSVGGDAYRLKNKIGSQAPCVPTFSAYSEESRHCTQ